VDGPEGSGLVGCDQDGNNGICIHWDWWRFHGRPQWVGIRACGLRAGQWMGDALITDLNALMHARCEPWPVCGKKVGRVERVCWSWDFPRFTL
jgi:hypothetical protein